jgi:hypothetical protein
MIGCSDVPACPPTAKETGKTIKRSTLLVGAVPTTGRRTVATRARKSRMDFGPEAE